MNIELEREIGRLLSIHKDARKVLNFLLKKYSKANINSEQRRTLINFALNAGSSKEAVGLFASAFKRKKKVPWYALLVALNRNDFEPNTEFFDNLFTAAMELEQLPEMTLFRAWDELNGQFKSERERIYTEKVSELEQKKQNLHEKINYFQAHRMIEEEHRALEQLKKMFPEDESITNIEKDLEQRWARHIINRSQLDNKSEKLFNQLPEIIDKQDLDFIHSLEDFTATLCRDSECKAYDFAIAFLFMECYEEAFRLASLAPASPSVHWLLVELLVFRKLYVEALDKIDQVELEYADDPETSFATAYLRAVCMHGLGQHTQAIELLQNIISVRPNYRAASSLLNDWQGQI